MKLKYDKLLSNVAFKCNLRHYIMVLAIPVSVGMLCIFVVGRFDPRLTPGSRS